MGFLSFACCFSVFSVLVIHTHTFWSRLGWCALPAPYGQGGYLSRVISPKSKADKCVQTYGKKKTTTTDSPEVKHSSFVISLFVNNKSYSSQFNFKIRVNMRGLND